jgi:hypothetical protein
MHAPGTQIMVSKRTWGSTAGILLLVRVLSLAWSVSSDADDPGLGHPVPSFKAVNETAISAILRFGSQSGIPIGIVLSRQLCSTGIGRLEIDHATVKEALDELARTLPRYTWIAEHGTVVLLPVEISAPMADFLSLNVNPYSVPEGTLQAQVAYEWMNIRATLRPNEGTAFSVLSSTKSTRWPPLRLGSATVREVLDRLVGRKPGGAWVLFPIDDLEKAAGSRPFQLIDYSDGSQMISTCSNVPSSGVAP